MAICLLYNCMISSREASKKYGIARATVELWYNKGKINRTQVGERYFYSEEQILEIINTRQKCSICGKNTGHINDGNKLILCETCKDKCRACGITLTSENRHEKNRICVQCNKHLGKVTSEKRRATNISYYQEAVNKSKLKTKLQVFENYSDGKITCNRCGYNDIRALSVDHIDGSGNKHYNKKGIKMSGQALYQWLKNNNFPPGYQILCLNCQFLKRWENKENSKYTRGCL